MAPIYFAKNASSKDNIPPLFINKGIKDKVPASLGSLTISGYPLYNETQYGVYKENISAFLYATAVQKKVFANVEGFDFRPRGYIALPHPRVKSMLQAACNIL
jgi:hypothetical protein